MLRAVFEQILEAASNKTVAVQPTASLLTNKAIKVSKTRIALLE